MLRPFNLTTNRAKGYMNLRSMLYEEMYEIFKNIKYGDIDDMRICVKKLIQIARSHRATLVLLEHRTKQFDTILEINLKLNNISFEYI